MEYKIGSNVIVDNEFLCEVVDIVTEDGIIYYEVSPLEFNNFTRFVTIDNFRL